MEGLYLLFKKLEDKYPRSHFGGNTHHITFDELREMLSDIIDKKVEELTENENDEDKCLIGITRKH